MQFLLAGMIANSLVLVSHADPRVQALAAAEGIIAASLLAYLCME